MTDSFVINLFINSDAILKCDALWSIQRKNTIYKQLSLGEYTIQEKYCDERFLVINFLSISCHQFQVWRDEFLKDKFHWIYLSSWGLLCFISYSECLSVIYNIKNYGSLPYILFIAVQNSRITLDRPQCIAICSKLKMESSVKIYIMLLAKHSKLIILQ